MYYIWKPRGGKPRGGVLSAKDSHLWLKSIGLDLNPRKSVLFINGEINMDPFKDMQLSVSHSHSLSNEIYVVDSNHVLSLLSPIFIAGNTPGPWKSSKRGWNASLRSISQLKVQEAKRRRSLSSSVKHFFVEGHIIGAINPPNTPYSSARVDFFNSYSGMTPCFPKCIF